MGVRACSMAVRRGGAGLLLLGSLIAGGWLAEWRPAQAFGPIGYDKELKLQALQANEMSRLDIRSGWLDGAPERMIFEIRNALAAPVYCSAVSVELKDRSKVVRSLEPAIWIPPSQMRRSGAKPLRKDEVRQFGLVCSCLRKAERGACEQPLRD